MLICCLAHINVKGKKTIVAIKHLHITQHCLKKKPSTNNINAAKKKRKIKPFFSSFSEKRKLPEIILVVVRRSDYKL